jgi:hypothetical protein
MSWKRAVFYGGAVLVLAACDNATAPTAPSLTRVNDVSASSKRASAQSAPETTADSTTVPGSGVKNTCSGMVIFIGLDGLLTTCSPTVW